MGWSYRPLDSSPKQAEAFRISALMRRTGKNVPHETRLDSSLASCWEPRGRLRSRANKKRLRIQCCCDHCPGLQLPGKGGQCVQIHPCSQNPAETSHELPDVTGSKFPHSVPGAGISNSWHKTQTWIADPESIGRNYHKSRKGRNISEHNKTHSRSAKPTKQNYET